MAIDPDPYRTLGLARGASIDEIKRAYRRLAKIHHPDAAGENERAAVPRHPGGLRAARRGAAGGGCSPRAGRAAEVVGGRPGPE